MVKEKWVVYPEQGHIRVEKQIHESTTESDCVVTAIAEVDIGSAEDLKYY
jgi:hypothetical protein